MTTSIDIFITNNFVDNHQRALYSGKARISLSLLTNNNIHPRVGEVIEGDYFGNRVALIKKITYNVTYKMITTIYHIKII